MASPTIPRRKPNYCLEAIDGELLLYHPNQGKILYCNPTASLIWQLCDGSRPVEKIIALLCAAFPEAQNIAAEVEATLQEFDQYEVIEYDPVQPGSG